MRNKNQPKLIARTFPKEPLQTWVGISLLLVLLALLSLGISSCAAAPASSPAEVSDLPLAISVNEAHELYQDGVLFLDVRTQEEWDDFHAPNSTHIPLDQLETRYSELPDDEQIVVVCRSGNRSQTGRDILIDNGFEQVTSMDGGLNAWRAAGFPTE